MSSRSISLERTTLQASRQSSLFAGNADPMKNGLMTGQIARLKITLDEIEPAIWREIEVPADAPLTLLHEAIQAAFLFLDYHLFAFETGRRGHERCFMIPDPDGDLDGVEDVRGIRLSDLILAGVKRLSYHYDFGDDWRFTVAIKAVAEATPSTAYPRFIAGANCAPPEDCGGPWGFDDLRTILADPRHAEHEERAQWYGRAFDPADISEKEIVRRMKRLSRRKSGKVKSGAPETR